MKKNLTGKSVPLDRSARRPEIGNKRKNKRENRRPYAYAFGIKNKLLHHRVISYMYF